MFTKNERILITFLVYMKYLLFLTIFEMLLKTKLSTFNFYSKI